MSKKVPEERSSEKMTSDLSRLLENKDFKSEVDPKNFLGSIDINNKIPNMPPKSAVEFAQDIIYDAFFTLENCDPGLLNFS